MRYRPESQLSRSISLQRSLQKGRNGFPSKVVLPLQAGQRMTPFVGLALVLA